MITPTYHPRCAEVSTGKSFARSSPTTTRSIFATAQSVIVKWCVTFLINLERCRMGMGRAGKAENIFHSKVFSDWENNELIRLISSHWMTAQSKDDTKYVIIRINNCIFSWYCSGNVWANWLVVCNKSLNELTDSLDFIIIYTVSICDNTHSIVYCIHLSKVLFSTFLWL